MARLNPTASADPAALADVDRVLICGDWHGAVAAGKSAINAAAELGIRTVLHVGDFGIGPWPGDSSQSIERRLQPSLDRHDIVMLVTPGNHENWDRIDAAPTDKHGRGILTDNVFVLPRGHRWTMAGKTFGSLGGAFSIDYRRRTPGASWWIQERVLPEHVDALAAGGPLDVLIAHEVPDGTPVRKPGQLSPDLEAQSREDRRHVLEAVARTTPELVFSGHWHQRTTGQVRYGTGITTVHVLDQQFRPGNTVVFDLVTGTVQPLPLALQQARAS